MLKNNSSSPHYQAHPHSPHLWKRAARKPRLKWQALSFVVMVAVYASAGAVARWAAGSGGSDPHLASDSPHARVLSRDQMDLSEPSQVRVMERACDTGTFPCDLFTDEQRSNGAIVLHFIGAFYAFYGIAYVCDDFFVESLTLITDRLSITDDVAGATFMAAGGSAPELFTSLVGTFFAENDIGFATIVGSAVFNVLFVIGICAVGAGEPLKLTWWPLARDSSYYVFGLIVLVLVVLDQEVQGWEAAILFVLYILYCVLMAYNVTLEAWVKGKLKVWQDRRGKTQKDDVEMAKKDDPPEDADKDGTADQSKTTDADSSKKAGSEKTANGELTTTGTSSPVGGAETNGSAKDKNQSDGSTDSSKDKSAEQEPSGEASGTDSGQNPKAEDAAPFDPSSPALPGRKVDLYIGTDKDEEESRMSLPKLPEDAMAAFEEPSRSESTSSSTSMSQDRMRPPLFVSRTRSLPLRSLARQISLERSKTEREHVELSRAADAEEGRGKPGEDRSITYTEAQDTSPFRWPKESVLKQTWFVLRFPLVAMVYLTIPDCRKPKMAKYYPLTFSLSLVWIGGFSWLLVWWATEIGIVLGIPSVVMGLTVLAAGTSVPDAVSSLLVAREGCGDMAVSSSIGSNAFDILVGLPVPWILHAIFIGGPVTIISTSLGISIAMLLGMVAAVILTIHWYKWMLTPSLGIVMMLLYFVFLTISLLLEYNVL